MSRWDKIRKGSLFSFKGGVFPPENKFTAGMAIEHVPAPEYLILPLKQHSGAPAEVLVKPGQKVSVVIISLSIFFVLFLPF